MNIIEPNQLLTTTVNHVVKESMKRFFKDGVELEKGAIITSRRIDMNKALYQKFCEHWSIYPDCFIDLITPSDSKFELKFFQRLFLRACLRYGRVLTIAPRAAGKSFICILALYLICIFRPKSHVFQCANYQMRPSSVRRIEQLV